MSERRILALASLLAVATIAGFSALRHATPAVQAQPADSTAPASADDIGAYYLSAAITNPTANQVFDVGQTVTFDGTASQGTITNYSWALSPGNPTSSFNGSTATTTFTTPGVYTLGLTVRDAASRTRTARIPVNIRRKIAIIPVGPSEAINAVSDPVFAGGQVGLRCVDDMLLSSQLHQDFGSGNHHYSLGNVQTFYDREFQSERPGSSASLTTVTVLPTITTEDIPPARGANDPCGPALDSFFNAKAVAAGLDLSPYQAVEYLYLHNNSTFQYFWSCEEGIGAPAARAYVDFGLMWDASPGLYQCDTRPVQLAAHELAHTLGATDTYAGFGCQDPNGIPFPNQDPKYPQPAACLMCGSKMIDANSSTSPSSSNLFGELLICPYSSTEIGWRKTCNNDGFCHDNPGLGLYEDSTCTDCRVPAIVCPGGSCAGGTCASAALGVSNLLSVGSGGAGSINPTVLGLWTCTAFQSCSTLVPEFFPQCDNSPQQYFNFSNALNRKHIVQAYYPDANFVDAPVNVTVDVISSASANGDPGNELLHVEISDNQRDWVACPILPHAKGTFTATVPCGRFTAKNLSVRFQFDTRDVLSTGAMYLRAIQRLAVTP
jgi:PKD repeat protein